MFTYAMLLLLSLLPFMSNDPEPEASVIRLDSNVKRVKDWTPPGPPSPVVGIWHQRGNDGLLQAKLPTDNVSSIGGLSVARGEIEIDMNGKTVWTPGVGIYGYDGIDGEFATKLLATGKTAESRARSRGYMLEDFRTPTKVIVKNGTIVAPRLTNMTGNVLTVGANFTYVTEGHVVGDDEKLPITYKALSRVGNPATVTGVTFEFDLPELAEWQPRVATDPANIAGYVVPKGPLGVVRLTATGKNRKDVPVSGSIDIQIVPGAATVIVVESLPVIDNP